MINKIIKTLLVGIFLSGLIFKVSLPALADDWFQEGHDFQRTGYSPESPEEPWSYLWAWNGLDNQGNHTNHRYLVPLESRPITGGPFVYMTMGSAGIFALSKADGSEAWNARPATFNATPAYDSNTGYLYAGGADGLLYKLDTKNGTVVDTYDAGNAIERAVLLVGDIVYVVTENGQLHKINTSDMSQVWIYSAGSNSASPATYSASKDLLVFCTADLYVHAVRNSKGTQHWRVKPTVHTPSELYGLYQYYFRWPVVADQHGIVFIRLRVDWRNDGGPTNADIRANLEVNPGDQNLFALDLDDGSKAFIPAVLPGGGDQRWNWYATTCEQVDCISSIATTPVVRILPDGNEVVYVIWRNEVQTPYDFRGDAVMGEMVLDNSIIPGMVAGDLRFIEFPHTANGLVCMIADEQAMIGMAGNTIFHNHFCYVEIRTVTDRSEARGRTFDDPIPSNMNPPIVPVAYAISNPNLNTHYHNSAISACATRWVGSGGFFIYAGEDNESCPDSIQVRPRPRPCFSDDDCYEFAAEHGSSPRFTLVSDGLIIHQGNRGDLFVLGHSGSSLPPPSPSPSLSPSPSPTPTPPPICTILGDVDCDNDVDKDDVLAVLRNWLSTSSNPARADVNGDGKVNGIDLGRVIRDWGV